MNEQERYIGLPREVAAECFDYDICGPECEQLVRKVPEILWEKDGVLKEAIITDKDTTCFGVNRYELKSGAFTLQEAPAIYVVVKGKGQLQAEDYSREIRQGDYFFMPYEMKGKVKAVAEEMGIVECLPPRQG